MAALHPKPEGKEPECYCGDVCKMEVSCDYNTLWQRFWICNNLTYDPEPCDTEPVPPLCDYKVWIDTERDAEAKRYLRNMVELNMMEEEFCACRMVERKRATYSAMQREMSREEYKDKREEERAR